jgi:hypothetical protein
MNIFQWCGMSKDIFISYRSADSEGWTNFIGTHLQQEFGEDRVYLDADSLEPGQRYAEVLLAQVAAAKVFIPVVGRNWLRATNKKSGMRRLDEPLDLLRREIETAIASGKLIIPVMVDDADIPTPADLPPSIRSLFEVEVVRITGKTKKGDISRLLASVRKALADKTAAMAADAAPKPVPPAPALPANAAVAAFVQPSAAIAAAATTPAAAGGAAVQDAGEILVGAIPSGLTGLCIGLIACALGYAGATFGQYVSGPTAALFSEPFSWMVPAAIYIIACGVVASATLIITDIFKQEFEAFAAVGLLYGVALSIAYYLNLRWFGLHAAKGFALVLISIAWRAYAHNHSMLIYALSEPRHNSLVNTYATRAVASLLAGLLGVAACIYSAPTWTFTFWPIVSVNSWAQAGFVLFVAIPVGWIVAKILA